MNLSQIIERKNKEFEKSMTCIDECKNGLYEDIGCPAHGIDAIKTKKFLEKAIRESVEEALREVRPEKKTAKKENGKISLRAEENRNGYNQCRFEMDARVKEFMK